MSQPPSFLLQAIDLTGLPNKETLYFSWTAGLHWVCGDEGRGKTTLLRMLAGDLPTTSGRVDVPAQGVCWVDLQNSLHDHTTVQACWDALRPCHPRWDDALLADLADALDMDTHRHKQLQMLSAGSRRKAAVLAALASGAAVTLLDQPFAALDLRSIRVLKDFLYEAAHHTERAWIVADYEAPPDLPLASVLQL